MYNQKTGNMEAQSPCFLEFFLTFDHEKTALDRKITRFCGTKKPRYIEFRAIGEPR